MFFPSLGMRLNVGRQKCQSNDRKQDPSKTKLAMCFGGMAIQRTDGRHPLDVESKIGSISVTRLKMS